ncbi:peptidoglycan-binding protein, partial [Streptomyces sp. SM11]|uniref:peptidoglycan-binding domain-containing protein n=1 Tax=Streptomyces sp. SM11 TaxID=565557 RepID=UPI0011B0CDF2
GSRTAAADPAPGGSRRRTAGMSPSFGPDPVQPRRRRPFGALAVGAAVAAVVGTAAFAGGLFGDDSRDEALPEATTSVPDTEDEPAASVAPSPSASATPSRTPSASATPSAPPSASASPTRSRKPTPNATASAPTASASSTADGGASPPPPSDAPPAELAGSSLRPGDRGPEVVELQNRLTQVGEWLYSGPPDGNYTDRVGYSVAIYQSYKAIQGDPAGVYGPNTRSALEAETNGRGRGRH